MESNSNDNEETKAEQLDEETSDDDLRTISERFQASCSLISTA
jgi:hypothetical protein